MIKIFVIGELVICTGLILSILIIIFLKKTIYYKYIDKTKKITSFDYLMDYDGNWLIKEIDFGTIIKENPSDENLIKMVNKIKILKKITVLLFVILIVFSAYMKVEKVI